ATLELVIAPRTQALHELFHALDRPPRHALVAERPGPEDPQRDGGQAPHVALDELSHRRDEPTVVDRRTEDHRVESHGVGEIVRITLDDLVTSLGQDLPDDLADLPSRAVPRTYDHQDTHRTHLPVRRRARRLASSLTPRISG